MSRWLLVMAVWSLPTCAIAGKIDPETGLRIAPGWQQVRAHCGGCHSHALVIQQRASRQGWLDIIRWMQASQNLWQFSPEVEMEILDYLEASYPPQANHRRAAIPPPLMPPAARGETAPDPG